MTHSEGSVSPEERTRDGTPNHLDGKHSGYRAGARAAVPFVLATAAVGVSFGVLARSLGWGVVAPIVFSVIAFSGSAQFAVAAVLGAGGAVVPAVVAAVLLNARF